MKLTIPELGNNDKGIYVLIINESFAYIGKSQNLKKRMIAWKHCIKHNFSPNKNILNILPNINMIRVEILEFIENELDRHDKEKYYIRLYKSEKKYNVLNISSVIKIDLQKRIDNFQLCPEKEYLRTCQPIKYKHPYEIRRELNIPTNNLPSKFINRQPDNT